MLRAPRPHPLVAQGLTQGGKHCFADKVLSNVHLTLLSPGVRYLVHSSRSCDLRGCCHLYYTNVRVGAQRSQRHGAEASESGMVLTEGGPLPHATFQMLEESPPGTRGWPGHGVAPMAASWAALSPVASLVLED